MYKVLGYRVQVVRTNLQKSFPKKTPLEIQTLEVQYFKQLADYVVETIKSFTLSKKEAQALGNMVPNQELWDLAASGRNVIISAGHLSNQELGCLYLSSSGLLPFTCVGTYHTLENKYFDALFKKSRTRFGAKVISMRETRIALKDQETHKPFALFLLNDQSAPPTKAYWSKFLNQDTGFYKGMGIIAQEHNMPVFYIHQTHTGRGSIQFSFTKICTNPLETPLETILEEHVRLLEKDIEQAPHTWFWSHKRWKHSKPSNV
jgi:Kdo2-lipid IVA lauroyltransferase/acyltransferase